MFFNKNSFKQSSKVFLLLSLFIISIIAITNNGMVIAQSDQNKQLDTLEESSLLNYSETITDDLTINEEVKTEWDNPKSDYDEEKNSFFHTSFDSPYSKNDDNVNVDISSSETTSLYRYWKNIDFGTTLPTSFDAFADKLIKYNGEESEKIEIIIKMNDLNMFIPSSNLDLLIEDANAEVIRQSYTMNSILVNVPILSVPNFIKSAQLLTDIKYVEPNGIIQAEYIPNDPLWDDQWGPQMIQTDNAWNIQNGSRDILVVVIDTGIDYTHEDLVDNYVAGGYDFINDDDDPMDDHYHGTHCAGTIAAAINNGLGISGVANVSVAAEKGLDSAGYGSDFSLSECIYHAIDVLNADILSNSWGSFGYSETIHTAITYASNAGALILAAAGNVYTDTPHYPAYLDEVIAVTATNSLDEHAGWCAYGDWMELAAPGENILSTVTGNDYDYLTGTSMATPHAAGVAALAWSQYPEMSALTLREYLHYVADDLGEPGFDNLYGYGRINALTAVEELPDHDLIALLNLERYIIAPNSTVAITATALNFGLNNESNVEIQIIIDNVSVSNHTFSLIHSNGGLESFTYNWTPSELGTYNITSYVVPVIGETDFADNSATKIATVTNGISPNPGEYIDFELTDLDGNNLMWFNTTYDYYIDDYLVNITWDDFSTLNQTWIVVDTLSREIVNSSNSYYIGLTYMVQIEPSTLYNGYTVNWWSGTGTVIGETTYLYKEQIQEAWILEVFNGAAITYYDKDTGVWLYYYNTLGSEMGHIIDTNIIPNIKYPHELSLNLETPSNLEPGENTIINTMITNHGLNDEYDIDVQLWINDIMVESTIFDTLLVNASETLTYNWLPPEDGTYNVTAYVVPVSDEAITLNNKETKMVSVYLLINYYMQIGATYDWIDATEGTLLPLGDDDSEPVALPFSFQFYDKTFDTIYVGSNGWLSFDNSDPYSLSNPVFPSTDSAHHYAVALFWDDLYTSGNIYALSLTAPNRLVIEYHDIDHFGGDRAGSFEVVFYETGQILFQYDYIDNVGSPTVGLNYGLDPTFFNTYNGFTSSTDNLSILFNYTPPEHDLAANLEVPSSLQPDDSTIINASVKNWGSNNETNVELQLWIDDIMVYSQTYATLLSGTSEGFSYDWSLIEDGSYNIRSYAVPVVGETDLVNNNVTKFTIVTSGISPSPGDYIDFVTTDLNGNDPFWFNHTCEYYITDYLVSFEWELAPNISTWIVVDTITREIVDSDEGIFTGLYYMMQIAPSNLYMGAIVNWFATSGTVIGETTYIYKNQIQDVWILEVLDGEDIAYYDKNTGVWLYFYDINTNDEGHIIDTNLIPNITYPHELNVDLEVPSVLESGETTTIYSTVTNFGLNDEYDVNLQLWINDIMVESTIFDTLLVNASETLTYNWLPPEIGTYNVTAYVVPVLDESFIINNKVAKTVTISDISTLNNYIMHIGAAYDWIDATGGTLLTLGDDNSEPVDLLFSFQFYDQVFTTIYVGSNGWLSFDNTYPSSLSNPVFPSTDPAYHYAVSLFWDDLYPDGNVYALTLTNPNRLVIEYHDINHCGGGRAGSFEVVFYETGEILFQYDYIDNVGSHTVGLNYGPNPAFYNYYTGLTSSTDNLAILFNYIPSDDIPPEFTMIPNDLTYEAGSTGNVISWNASDSNPETYNITLGGVEIAGDSWTTGVPISIDIDGLAVGSYTYEIIVEDTYGNSATDTVLVTVVDTTSPTFTNPADISYLVNSTGINLSWIVSDVHQGTYSITLDGVEVTNGSWTSGVSITIDIDGLAVGSYTYEIIVEDFYSNSATDTVLVTVFGIAAPPTVIVTYPNGGEVLSATVTITWTATDPNDDSMTYSVYLWDGTSWTELTSGLTNTNFVWDTTTVKNGHEFKIKVIASDGLLTGEDESNNIFEIKNSGKPTPGFELLFSLLAIVTLYTLKYKKREKE